MDQTVAVVDRLVRSGVPHQHVVINVNKVVAAARDPDLRRIINSCSLVNVDGMPIVWASRLLRKAVKERVAGIDLFMRLMAEAPVRGWRVYLLGAREDVVTEARRQFELIHPGIQIVGHRDGYWVPEQAKQVALEIMNTEPHLLFVAVSSPHKERFLNRYQPIMRVPFAMGVGGSFDVVAGRTKRAPVWMRNVGLEWFFRFLQEPRRMFRRYFLDGMAFFPLILRELARRK